MKQTQIIGWGSSGKLSGNLGFNRRFRRWHHRAIAPLIAAMLAVASGANVATLAAESLTFRLGPWQGSIALDDLEEYARTGELPGNLAPLGPFLPDGLQEVLAQRVEIDPDIGDRALDRLITSPQGNRFVRAIFLLVPDSTIDQIKDAIKLVATQGNGLSLLGILKALPGDNIVFDATSAIGVASRLNLPYLEGQILRSRLESDLELETEPFYSSFDPALPGSQTVSQQTLTFRDRQRNREITTEIYSGNNPQGPLAVISHGFASNRFLLEYLAQHLASHGITVVSIEHPDINEESVANLPLTLDPTNLIPASVFLDLPKDVSFILDELAEINRQPGSLAGQFNTEQTLVIGHSFGGYASLALAGGELNLNELREFCEGGRKLGRSPADLVQCAATELPGNRITLRDRRIKQAVAINPTVGNLFGDKGLGKIDIPILLVASSDDSWTPAVNHQLRPFTQLREPKYLLTAIGGTHFSTTDPSRPSLLERETALPDDPSREQTENLRLLLRGVTLAFVKQQTPEARTYAPFLSAAYAQSLGTEETALRLNETLPTRLARWLATSEAALGRLD
ncbi:alpha/beta hydrolase [Oscillatoria acuminata]|uniref:Putative dienelactone hydrolase n=1 Tax=Oscillatoria acuminata PCC 6304 TaxID=56110 RepID=K9TJC9_9CYAN|nr:alpha/beta hydrolase [Oscillatoria acuminata]AFY82655.1 putative dienelactone hydrolase [Oscillatoria acuminata PCC 6304]